MAKFGSCLIVSRHKLLSVQEEDIKNICGSITVIPELPLDQQKLKFFIEPYDVVIGSFPVNLQIEILKNKKILLTFVMTSLGVTDTRQEAESIASQYPGRVSILAPSKEGEKYRTVRYDGLKEIKEIRVIDEWVVQHLS